MFDSPSSKLIFLLLCEQHVLSNKEVTQTY